jgi:hypothetical protein
MAMAMAMLTTNATATTTATMDYHSLFESDGVIKVIIYISFYIQ